MKEGLDNNSESFLCAWTGGFSLSALLRGGDRAADRPCKIKESPAEVVSAGPFAKISIKTQRPKRCALSLLMKINL